MKLSGRHLKRVAQKLGFVIKEGRNHILIKDSSGTLITTVPRGEIKHGTLIGILKRLGISKAKLEDLL